jgi:F-type H+-transporting ATPase subunit delta
VVLENGRLDVLPEVAAQFRSLVNSKSGSRMPWCTALSRLRMQRWPSWRHAGKALWPQAESHREADESLIGGVRVVVGDEVLDTSVKARLEQMKAALTA